MINEQIDSLYWIVHCQSWSCSVQAMMLLYTIVTSHRRCGDEWCDECDECDVMSDE